MLLVLFYVLIALAFGGYPTWLLATVLPQSLLDRASRHGRFADLSDEPAAVSDTKTSAQPIADKNASRC